MDLIRRSLVGGADQQIIPQVEHEEARRGLGMRIKRILKNTKLLPDNKRQGRMKFWRHRQRDVVSDNCDEDQVERGYENRAMQPSKEELRDVDDVRQAPPRPPVPQWSGRLSAAIEAERFDEDELLDHRNIVLERHASTMGYPAQLGATEHDELTSRRERLLRVIPERVKRVRKSIGRQLTKHLPSSLVSWFSHIRNKRRARYRTCDIEMTDRLSPAAEQQMLPVVRRPSALLTPSTCQQLASSSASSSNRRHDGDDDDDLDRNLQSSETSRRSQGIGRDISSRTPSSSSSRQRHEQKPKNAQQKVPNNNYYRDPTPSSTSSSTLATGSKTSAAPTNSRRQSTPGSVRATQLLRPSKQQLRQQLHLSFSTSSSSSASSSSSSSTAEGASMTGSSSRANSSVALEPNHNSFAAGSDGSGGGQQLVRSRLPRSQVINFAQLVQDDIDLSRATLNNNRLQSDSNSRSGSPSRSSSLIGAGDDNRPATGSSVSLSSISYSDEDDEGSAAAVDEDDEDSIVEHYNAADPVAVAAAAAAGDEDDDDEREKENVSGRHAAAAAAAAEDERRPGDYSLGAGNRRGSGDFGCRSSAAAATAARDTSDRNNKMICGQQQQWSRQSDGLSQTSCARRSISQSHFVVNEEIPFEQQHLHHHLLHRQQSAANQLLELEQQAQLNWRHQRQRGGQRNGSVTRFSPSSATMDDFSRYNNSNNMIHQQQHSVRRSVPRSSTYYAGFNSNHFDGWQQQQQFATHGHVDQQQHHHQQQQQQQLYRQTCHATSEYFTNYYHQREASNDDYTTSYEQQQPFLYHQQQPVQAVRSSGYQPQQFQHQQQHRQHHNHHPDYPLTAMPKRRSLQFHPSLNCLPQSYMADAAPQDFRQPTAAFDSSSAAWYSSQQQSYHHQNHYNHHRQPQQKQPPPPSYHQQPQQSHRQEQQQQTRSLVEPRQQQQPPPPVLMVNNHEVPSSTPVEQPLVSPQQPAQGQRIVLHASTSQLLKCLSDFLKMKCRQLEDFKPSQAIAWLRGVDRSLTVQNWQEIDFINPANVVFLYMLLRELVHDKIGSERELQSIMMTALYLSYAYMGNEISYPLQPFLCDHDNHESFWDRTLFIINKLSAKMLKINAEQSFFAEVFSELMTYHFDVPAPVPSFKRNYQLTDNNNNNNNQQSTKQSRSVPISTDPMGLPPTKKVRSRAQKQVVVANGPAQVVDCSEMVPALENRNGFYEHKHPVNQNRKILREANEKQTTTANNNLHHQQQHHQRTYSIS